MTEPGVSPAPPDLGPTSAKRISLRFAFEVAGVCEAADLAAELRTLGRGTVQVRPATPRTRCAVRWTVVLTTPSLPLRLDVLQALEGELHDVAQRRPGRRLRSLTLPWDGVQRSAGLAP